MTTIPPIVPVDPRIDPVQIDLGKTPTTIDIGIGTLPNVPPQPLQPTPDHSARATPRGDKNGWVTTIDYPPSAVRAGVEGRTGFRLDIGIDGKPTACTIVSSSGSDELDGTTCRLLMRRARFTTAKDEGGNPTVSTYANAVTWKLPAD
jgi:protein TonB